MSRYIAALAAALTMLISAGPAAAFDVSQTLDVGLKKEKPDNFSQLKELAKKKKVEKLKGKKQLNLSFSIVNKATDGVKEVKSPPANLTEIYLPKFSFNQKKFPKCSADLVSLLRFDLCSKAKIGQGTATINATPQIEGDLKADVTIYNGANNKKSGTLYIVMNVVETASITQVLPATLKNSSDGSGKVLSVSIPDQPLPLFPNEFAAIKTLSVKVGAIAVKKKKIVNFLQTPRKCKRGLQFSETTTFKPGYASTDTATATDLVKFKCK